MYARAGSTLDRAGYGWEYHEHYHDVRVDGLGVCHSQRMRKGRRIGLNAVFGGGVGRLWIRCNSIAPGPIPTEGAFSRLMAGDMEEKAKNRVALRRFGKPSELADLAVFDVSCIWIRDGGGDHNRRRGMAQVWARV